MKFVLTHNVVRKDLNSIFALCLQLFFAFPAYRALWDYHGDTQCRFFPGVHKTELAGCRDRS